MTGRFSTYSEYLPVVLQSPEPGFLDELLTAFETVLTGVDERTPAGLEHTITGLASYFDPQATPAKFLPWLAQWVALTLREDWDEPTRRAFIAGVVPLYRRRGTLTGLRQMLALYLAAPQSAGAGSVDRIEDVQIEDQFPQRPHYFQVRIVVRKTAVVADTDRTARAIIDREKPAHTYYGLRLALPAMRIVSPELKAKLGPDTPVLIVGKTTRLGSVPARPSEGA